MDKKSESKLDNRKSENPFPADGSGRMGVRDESVRLAQQILRKNIQEGTPLVDEFIKERRNEAEKV